jgi:membrane glycosyltransferase
MNMGVRTSEATAPAAPHAFEHLPHDAPIAMPVQDFAARPEHGTRRPLNIDLWARRMLVVLLALLPASIAAHDMRRSIGLDGISAWEGVYLTLFIPLFAWIAFGFATAMIGFLLLTVGTGDSVRPARLQPSRPLKGRTAILLISWACWGGFPSWSGRWRR